MVWSLALCTDDAKQNPVVYDAEFGVVFLAKGPRTLHPYRRVSIASAFTIRVLKESATFEECVVTFSFGMVIFYLVTTGWIFYTSFCENSINHSLMIAIPDANLRIELISIKFKYVPGTS